MNSVRVRNKDVVNDIQLNLINSSFALVLFLNYELLKLQFNEISSTARASNPLMCSFFSSSNSSNRRTIRNLQNEFRSSYGKNQTIVSLVSQKFEHFSACMRGVEESEKRKLFLVRTRKTNPFNWFLLFLSFHGRDHLLAVNWRIFHIFKDDGCEGMRTRGGRNFHRNDLMRCSHSAMCEKSEEKISSRFSIFELSTTSRIYLTQRCSVDFSSPTRHRIKANNSRHSHNFYSSSQWCDRRIYRTNFWIFSRQCWRRRSAKAITVRQENGGGKEEKGRSEAINEQKMRVRNWSCQ